MPIASVADPSRSAEVNPVPQLQLLVLQPTPFCNIACTYCYLPDRSSGRQMARQTAEQVFSRLLSAGWLPSELDVLWHAGEPLVLPVDYYAQMFAAIDGCVQDKSEIHYYFQTNGMLIDDEWCKFFRATGAKIGVSIDGPQAIHDSNRVTRKGRGTFAQTLAGIRRLQQHDVEFSVISVLGAASLDKAQELHDFYVGHGIANVCFNVEEIEGPHTSTSLRGGESETKFENFMRRFWNLTVRSGQPTFVREFDEILKAIVRPLEGSDQVNNTLVEPFAILSVDCDGNFSTYSPELLGQKSELYGDFILGNVWKDSFEASCAAPAFQRLSSDVAEGVELCRRSCEYFPVCGGGSPVNKYYENGTLRSSETMYCRLNIKAVSDIAMEIIDNSAGQWQARGASFPFPR
jgi:uncharacterized protein